MTIKKILILLVLASAFAASSVWSDEGQPPPESTMDSREIHHRAIDLHHVKGR